MRLYKYFSGLIFFILFFQNIFSNPQLDLIDTPTAATLPRGAFNITMLGYEQGGILNKTAVGLHDNIFLGVSFDIEHVIGRDKVKFNIPGVLARIKITDSIQDIPVLISFGYDSFYPESYQQINPDFTVNSRLIYGPYLVITKPLFTGTLEHHLHIGVRLPVQPYYQPDESSMFIGYDLPLGQFVPMMEVEKILFNQYRLNEYRFNTGIRFNLYDSLALEINFMLTGKKETNRVVNFEYAGSF